jgi:acetyl esterase/lipase
MIAMPYSKQTVIYKTVQDLPIHADVYLPQGEKLRPAILWLHGGALIFGNRTMLPLEQTEMYLKAGFAVVAIDYRLAPEAKLEAILEDLRDAAHWVRGQGADVFHLDPDRLAVVGHSAGGYLTLMAGFCVHPRPKALVSFYGYGDIVGDWYSRPDPHYCQEPAVAVEIARQGVGRQVLTGSPFTGDLDPRWLFYLFCRQQGLWPKEVAGYDPQAQPQAFEKLCPVRNVSQEYPPTLLLHGDEDTDVPYEQSQEMAEALRKHHVPHRLVRMKGLGHGFDFQPGLVHPEVAQAFEAVVAFLA